MCKANNEIITKIQELMELRRMSEELQAEIDTLQEAVKGSHEEDIPKLLHIAVQQEQYDASGALDTIGTAIYDLRVHIRDLQAAQTKEVIRISEQEP